jgi:EAL domain-containing protein (putative c-di-GMP-specific phosphodiesterase class I)
MTATRSGQIVFVIAIVGVLGFLIAPNAAPALAAIACWVSVALIAVGISTYRPAHKWPWILLAVRWAVVGLASTLQAAHLSIDTNFAQDVLLELTRIASLVSVAALFLYARPRRLLDVTTALTIVVFGFASVLALTPSEVAHLSATKLFEPALRPEVFAAFTLVTWFLFGFLVMRLGPVLPTALARLGLGAWLAIGVVGSVAVAHVMTGSSRPLLVHVSYLYVWIMALSTASGGLHPSMAHLRPTSDRVWTPVVQRAAYFGAIFVVVPLALLVPQVFDTEAQEFACYATLALVVFVSVLRIVALNQTLSVRSRFRPWSLRELVPAETREIQGLIDEVRVADLQHAADVLVVTFTLRGLNELRLLVGSPKQVSIEEHWAGNLLALLPGTVRAIRLRPGCVVAVTRCAADRLNKTEVVLELARAVKADTTRVSDGSIVLDVVVGASEIPHLDVASLELAIGLAERQAVSLKSQAVSVATLEENELWHLKLTAASHLRADETLSSALTILGEPFVDLHTNHTVGTRIVAAYQLDWDVEFSGEELRELLAQARVEGRFYAAVFESTMAWATVHLAPRSLLVLPVSSEALLDDEFISRALRVLANAKRPQFEVWLELPAEELTAVTPALADRLDFMALQGVKLMVGDFGRRHADLAGLATLPLHALALNENFVATVGLYLRSGVLASNVASMAWDLDYVVVAGGIRYDDQRAELADAACKYAWGPLFGDLRTLVAPKREQLDQSV